jgi:long-chain acyl-CoA synthetase
MNLFDVFLETANRQPDHAAIIGSGQDDFYSYDLLLQKIESAALCLKEAGIRPGSCVGLHYPSGRDYIILTYAIWRCGCCVVPITVELALEEKQRIFREISLDAVILKAGATDVIKPFQAGEFVPVLENAVTVAVKSPKRHPPEFQSINPAFLRFTSGTTDISKGIVLSHETIRERIDTINNSLRIGPEDRIIWLMSMGYNFVSSIISYLSFGAGIVLCKNFFAATIIETAIRHQATVIFGSPVHYELMAFDPTSLSLPGIRLAMSTTTSLRNDVAQAFYKRFNKSLNEVYGIIEVGLPCINLDKSIEKMGSVGRPLPGYEIRLEDTGLEKGLKAIKVRGKGIFDAYYSPWRPRDEVMRDGWFSTGDIGVADNDGYLYIQGRTKEIINVGGFKFFLREVEALLESHPAVKECRVFPYRDKRSGEVPYAEVVIAESVKNSITEKELKDYCLQRLALYKVPGKIMFVDKLPRTASGKLVRQTTP